MSRPLTLLLAVVSTAVVGCYQAHLRPANEADDGALPDAGPLDAWQPMDAARVTDASRADVHDALGDGPDLGHDANPPPLEAGACDRHWVQFAQPCTPDLDAYCHRRVMEWAHGRYGRTLGCVTGPDHFNSGCTIGDLCSDTGTGVWCQCTPTRLCSGDDVCVSDTPDGPTRCVPRCSGL